MDAFRCPGLHACIAVNTEINNQPPFTNYRLKNFWYNLAEPGTGVEGNTKFEAH